jgi:hypothetical protein
MKFRRTYALCGAIAALAAVPGSALAAGTKVTVRVEGVKTTLLAAKSVQTRSGSITRYGAPPGTCPQSSAAGALDVATRGRWGGTFSQSLNQIELTSIMRENWPFTQLNDFWAILVNNRYATVGMCQISLHRGDRVLFAAVSEKTPKLPHPLGVTAPARARAGRSFKVKVVYYSDAGKAKPLKGVRIGGGTTNAKGIVKITPKHTGRLRLKAGVKGYIRSAAQWVRVSA